MKANSESAKLIQMTEEFCAHNYAPLEIVAQSAEGAWVTDVDGKKYIDLLSAYSALNFGHRNPRILAAVKQQLEKLTLICRAFMAEETAYACRDLAQLCRKDKVLLMNSGAEAVETAIKCVRKWGYEVKGVPVGAAEIICMDNNFHGRTTTIVSFSTSSESQTGFGPFTPGFVVVPFGDLRSIEKAINKNTVAVLFEPILGEGGYILPPDGFCTGIREICNKNNVVMIADEVQTGLCRTGEVFACDHEAVEPDIFILGKSLGGGIMPVSAIAANNDLMNVFTPGVHGSTFGANPLACAIVREIVAIIREEEPHKQARVLAEPFVKALHEIKSEAIDEIRAKALMIGVDINPRYGSAKDFCKKLKYEGLLCKDTREQTIRFAPPLVISKEDLAVAAERIKRVFEAATPIS